MASVSSDYTMPASVRILALQGRIGWICQIGRVLAAGYALWTLWLTATFFADGALVGRRFGMIAGLGPVEVTSGQQWAGFGLVMVDWLVLAITCGTAWQLFTSYLNGRIFTPDAANLLRRTALSGIAAVLLDLALRPVLVWLVAGTVPAYAKASWYYFSPHDLALLAFLVSLFAIAHIFKVAAELAEENAEIL